MATLDWVGLALDCVPRANIFVALLEADVSEGEPQKKTTDGEEVLGRDHESIHDEEAGQEMHSEEELSVAESAEASVALEDLPVEEGLLTVATEPVVLLDAELANQENTDTDGRGVGESDIHEEMVPPAFTEVWEDVLPRELKELIKD